MFERVTRGAVDGADQIIPGVLGQVCTIIGEAGGNIIEQGETACCYAKSEKSWIDDPAGIAWETFLTTGESITYGDGTGENRARVAHEGPSEQQSSCCAPSAPPKQASACC